MSGPCPHCASPFRRRPTRQASLALGLIALASVGLMWPLVLHLSSRVPGTATWAFDEYTFLWNDWYFGRALLGLHASPLHTQLIWFPLGIDLVLYTFNFTNAALALPFQLAANLVLASNLTLLLATLLSGFGAFLLASYLLSARDVPAFAAALLAGILYAASANRAVYLALGHYNFATSEWLPFYTLCLCRLLRGPARRSRRGEVPSPPAAASPASPPASGISLAPPSPRVLVRAVAGERDALLAGLFFALAAWTEMTFASFLALLSVVVWLASWRSLARPWAALGRLALVATIALLLWSPVLVPTVRDLLDPAYGASGWGESLSLSADLLGLVTPGNLNPLLAPPPAAPLTSALADGERPGWQAELRAVAEGKGRFGDINTVFLGYATLALALLGVLVAGRRRAAPWVWSALVFGILSLGPLLQIGGRYRFSLDRLLPEGVTIPLPFALLHFVPFLNANRAPNRFSLLVMLALSALVAFGAYRLLGGRSAAPGSSARALRGPGPSPWRTWTLAPLLAAVLIVEHLAVPLPTTDARVPEIYRQIGAEPGRFSVLQLPLGWRNSYETFGSEDTRLQYYQSVSGKPIIGGNISRAPAFEMDYFRRIPLFQALTDLEMYQDVPPAVDAAARTQAGALATLYNIHYLVTFPPVPGRYPYQDTWQRVQDYALKVLPVEPEPFWQNDGVRAYRIVPPPVPSPFHLDLGPGAEAYLGQGWDANLQEQPYSATATWIDGTRADLYLPSSGPADCTLRLAIAPLAYPAVHPQQTLTLSVNGAPLLARQPLLDGWHTITVRVPVTATLGGPNLVRLSLGWAATPRLVFPDPASRAVIGTTGLVSPVNLEVHSFSEAFITATARDGTVTDASAGRQGYDVAVLDPRSGQVLDRQGFDTASNSYEADRLAAYVRGLRAGGIVVVATRGDAAAHLTQQAVDALRGLGSRAPSPAALAGQAQALVGVQGAPPGSAAEVIAPGSAYLRVGGDFRALSAAVAWVELVR